MFPHCDHKGGYTIFKGVTKALCMNNPIKELIIENTPGAVGVQNCPSENECNEQDTNETEIKQVNDEVDENKMNDDKEQNETQPSTAICGAEIPTNKDNQHSEITNELKESNDCEQAAAVQSRAMKEKESKPKKQLKVAVITGLNIRPKQLIEQQKNDETLKRYWKLVDKPKVGEPQFITKNGILYRKYEKCDVKRIQLMVPSEL